MIIASFTTIPERLDKGLPRRCIETLLAQERRADLILINIPRISRKGKIYDQQAAEALNQVGVIVNWTDKDYGPITKLFGSLDYIEKHGIKDARIIMIDDDVKYEPWVFKRLINEGGQATGFVSRDAVFKNGRLVSTEWKNKGAEETTLLETYAGVIYDANLFLPYSDLRNWYSQLHAKCHNADDIVIAEWINRKGVALNRLHSDKDSAAHDSGGTPELRTNNLSGNNLEVLQYFIDQKSYWYDVLYWLLLFCIVMAAVYGLFLLLASVSGSAIPGKRMRLYGKRR